MASPRNRHCAIFSRRTFVPCRPNFCSVLVSVDITLSSNKYCCILRICIDDVVATSNSRQLKYNVGDGRVKTEEFLQGCIAHSETVIVRI